MQHPTATFASLPGAVAGRLLAALPLAQRVQAAPLVCTDWRALCAGPYAPFHEVEWTVCSFDQLLGLLRWLTPRAPILRTLRLNLRIRNWRRQSHHRSLKHQCTASTVALMALLPQATNLEHLSLTFNICNGHERAPLWLALPPLPPGALPRLRRLELATGWRMCLPAFLPQLPAIQELHLSGTIIMPPTDNPQALQGLHCDCPPPQPHLPPSLTRLELAGSAAAASASQHPQWACHLPHLRSLQLSAAGEEDAWWGADAAPSSNSEPGARAEAGPAFGGEDSEAPPPSARFQSATHDLLTAWAAALAGSLQHLSLASAPPPTLGELVTLRTLSVAGADIHDTAPGWTQLSTLSNLQALAIHVQASATASPPHLALPTLPPNLTELSLSNNAKASQVVLPDDTYLGSLRRMTIVPGAAAWLPTLLPRMPQLQHLRIVGAGDHSGASPAHQHQEPKEGGTPAPSESSEDVSAHAAAAELAFTLLLSGIPCHIQHDLAVCNVFIDTP